VIDAALAAHARKGAAVLVALDGRSGTGKSTLSKELAGRLRAVAVTADDFWSGGSDEQWAMRTVRERVAVGERSSRPLTTASDAVGCSLAKGASS
jgi:hypothetical protein